MDNKIILGTSDNPWHNLALEELLYRSEPAGAVLYLWQNRNTVVIGRNQNAWRECRAELLEQEGGRLARRSSGGGAVFHDMGNLNFTFLLPRQAYDLQRQFSVLQAALADFGIKACPSGRNDLILESGEKFSGNAFQFNRAAGLQHGTLLVAADMEKLGRYLVPSRLKLQAKGIASVKSRVKNLAEVNPSLTVEALKEALPKAFAREYGGADFLTEEDLDKAALQALEEKYSAWSWRFGEAPGFEASYETRFPWGEISLYLNCEKGMIRSLRVYTDAMDEHLAEILEQALTGCPMDSRLLAERLRGLKRQEGQDLAAYILQQN